MSKLFLTYEVGSLPKLDARVKALAANLSKNPVTGRDISDFERYASMAGLDVFEIVDILKRQITDGTSLKADEKSAIIDANAAVNIRLQEIFGLDFIYDGEARRTEMYRHVATQVQGFKDFPEMIRSRGPDSWRAAICVDEPRLRGSLDELQIIKEFEFVRNHATHKIKVPIDDPYMIANMTDNRHYMENLAAMYENDPRRLRYEAKRALTLALAQNVIRPQVEAAVKTGAKWIQLDIPSATIDVEHIPIMVEGINAVVSGIEGVKFSLHLCYPRQEPPSALTSFA